MFIVFLFLNLTDTSAFGSNAVWGGVNSRFGRERGNLQESKPSFRLKDRESKRQMEGNRSINLGKVSKNAGNRCG